MPWPTGSGNMTPACVEMTTCFPAGIATSGLVSHGRRYLATATGLVEAGSSYARPLARGRSGHDSRHPEAQGDPHTLAQCGSTGVVSEEPSVGPTEARRPERAVSLFGDGSPERARSARGQGRCFRMGGFPKR